MLERDANRKYRFELGAALVAYLLAVYGSVVAARPLEPGLARTLLVLVPVLPMAFAVWAVARHFRRMDEFQRLRSLEGVAIGAAITAGLSLTYGFLESAGFPKLSMFWVWPVMGFSWGLFGCLRCAFTR